LKNEKHALTTFEKMFDTNRFETILQSISDGVIAIDLDRRLTCFNTASERIFGRKREDVLGKRCDEIIQSSVCDGSCTLDYTMETGTPVVNLPIQVKNLHGEEIPVTVSTAPIRDRNGKIVGGVETLRDLNMVRRLLDEVGNGLAVRRILTADTRVKKLLEMVPMIARSESTVLIEGESGTGKGLLAQAIHEADTRRTGPLVTVNCGALPENLLESELFGYKAGAFTDAKKDKPGRVAAAKGGTLFLDEIGDLPLSLQVKILHLLQEKRYEPLGAVESVRADVRIVAATNRNLMEMMEKGTFREDLYYRINVIPLSMPPLRERKSDIPLLAESFLRGLSIARGKAFEGISRDALESLMRYGYPGNVRELENILEHAFVLCTGGRLEVRDLPSWFAERVSDETSPARGDLKAMEAAYLREVLARNSWNRSAAARELGIHVTTLHRRVRRLGIQLPSRDGRSSRG